jgi:hypothetical protein
MICVFAWPNVDQTVAGNTASFTARLSRCSVPPRALIISSPRRPVAMFMPTPLPALSPAKKFAKLPNADVRSAAAPVAEFACSGVI